MRGRKKTRTSRWAKGTIVAMSTLVVAFIPVCSLVPLQAGFPVQFRLKPLGKSLISGPSSRE
jgi:hypothetical protein